MTAPTLFARMGKTREMQARAEALLATLAVDAREPGGVDRPSAKFDPNQRRDDEGRWAGLGNDKLKGAGRIDLEPGERLLKSDRTKGEQGRAWLAVTEKDGKRSLRIGLGNATFGTRHDHGGPWRAGPDRTAEIDKERAELRADIEELENELESAEADPDTDPVSLAARRAQLEELYGAESDVAELPGGYTAMLDENSARQLRETLAKALGDGEKLQAELDKPYAELDRLTLERDKLKRKAMGRKFTDEEDAEWDWLTGEITRAEAELDPDSGPERPESGYWTLAEGSIPGQWADVHYDIFLDDPDLGVEVKLGAVPHGSDMDFDDMRGAEMIASFAMSEADELVRLLAKMDEPAGPAASNRTHRSIRAHSPGGREHNQQDHAGGTGGGLLDALAGVAGAVEADSAGTSSLSLRDRDGASEGRFVEFEDYDDGSWKLWAGSDDFDGDDDTPLPSVTFHGPIDLRRFASELAALQLQADLPALDPSDRRSVLLHAALKDFAGAGFTNEEDDSYIDVGSRSDGTYSLEISGGDGEALQFDLNAEELAALHASIAARVMSISNRGKSVRAALDEAPDLGGGAMFFAHVAASRARLRAVSDNRDYRNMPPAFPTSILDDAIAAKFDPSQPRDGEGKWTDGLADKLKLDGRIKLSEGQHLRASGSYASSHNLAGPNVAVMALIDTRTGPQLRLGVVDGSDKRRWAAAKRGSTVQLDEAGITQLDGRLTDLPESVARIGDELRQIAAKVEAIGEDRWGYNSTNRPELPMPRSEMTEDQEREFHRSAFTFDDDVTAEERELIFELNEREGTQEEGVLAAGPWGELRYRIVADELQQVHVELGVKPDNAEPDWSFEGDVSYYEDQLVLMPKDLPKFRQAIAGLASSPGEGK